MLHSDIIEFEDYGFNHYIHHFDECDGEHLLFNEEYDCLQADVDLMEEIIWA
jgi:hypothetical protein